MPSSFRITPSTASTPFGEDKSTRFKAWVAERLDVDSQQLASKIQLNHVGLDARCKIPDVHESCAGEVDTPAEGEWNCADGRADLVTPIFGMEVCLVAVPPHAVKTVDTFRFTK